MKLENKIKRVNESLNSAVIKSFETEEKIEKEIIQKKDLKELKLQVIKEEGILKRNKSLLNEKEVKAIEGGIGYKKHLAKLIDINLQNPINKYKACLDSALDYIKATKSVPDSFADIVMDFSSFDSETTLTLNNYIKEAQEKGLYCKEIYSVEKPQKEVHSRSSYLMHNEAYKNIIDRMYNSGDNISLKTEQFFLHFDPRVELQFNDLNLDNKLESLKRIAKEKEKENCYFGVGRAAVQKTIGGRELIDSGEIDIQFRENLTSYFQDLSTMNKSSRYTMNIKTALSNKSDSEIDLLSLAKKDISHFYKEKTKKKLKRSL